jgi:polygalacturonase
MIGSEYLLSQDLLTRSIKNLIFRSSSWQISSAMSAQENGEAVMPWLSRGCRDLASRKLWPGVIATFAALTLEFLFVPGVYCQDTRDVEEPKIPAICVRLAANLKAENEDLQETAEASLDTARIQAAIDQCQPSMAVALQSDGANNAFLSGPLELKPGVTLVVRRGVVLFGSRNPREYDVQPGSCGLVNQDGRGCKPLLHASHAPHTGVMGEGTIDGQGGRLLLHSSATWWELAQQAKVEDKKQNCPRIIVVDSSDDFTLYGITLKNSPNFHVLVSRTNGFTAWGVKIDSPATARNTDGIDPSSSTNVTIAYSWIRAGDDNIAIKAGKNGSAAHMTILRNHFYSGHGMSIGSETEGGVSAIRVTDLTIDGADNGIRIKSDVSRGGLVRDVVYQDVCLRDVKNPIILDPFYSKTPGDLVPVYQDIGLRNIHSSGGGKITLRGFDGRHLLQAQFDGVTVDGLKPSDFRAAHARLVFGPGAVSLLSNGADVEVTHATTGEKGEAPQCNLRFVPFPTDNMVIPLQKTAAGGAVVPRESVTAAADGSGDVRSIQEAIDRLSSRGGTVRVKPGTYREVIRVDRPHIRLEGLTEDPAKVVIVYGNSASITGSTFTSATVSVTGDDFYSANITFQNDFSRSHELKTQGSQAVALSVTADRAVFRNVRFLGAQDTLYAASRSCRSETGPCMPARQYFADCYIEGHVDFIFGDAQAMFEHCSIHAIAHPDVMLTAQSKKYPEQESGFVFDRCTVTADPGVGRIFLGRPWRAYASVVFLNSELDQKVAPEGWREWHPGQTERLNTAAYAEYKSTGLGAQPKSREPYSRQLTEDQASKFEGCAFLAGVDGWNPCAK